MKEEEEIGGRRRRTKTYEIDSSSSSSCSSPSIHPRGIILLSTLACDQSYDALSEVASVLLVALVRFMHNSLFD